MIKFFKLLFWLLVGFFCWGWVSNVLLGGMTTNQYIQKLDADFQRWVIRAGDNAVKTGPATGITNNVKSFYNS